MERIVLDTNCLIQSIPSRSKYRKIWDSFFDGTNILCVTTSILNEYEEILELLTNEETAKYIINAIVSSPYTQFVNVYFAFNLIEKDPDDNKFVDCAITAGARFIVTEDHHYDVIKWKEFPGIGFALLESVKNTNLSYRTNSPVGLIAGGCRTRMALRTRRKNTNV